MGLAALAGFVTSLGLAPFALWPLALVALACVFLVVSAAPSRRAAAFTGWAAGTGYFAFALIWLIEPFMVDPWRHAWMAPFALFFMSAGLALFWGLATGFAHARGRLAFIGALTLAEVARSYLFTGFPWALLGYLWSESPLAIYAAYIGPHGLTLVALLTAVSLATRPLRAALLGYAPFAAVLAALALAPQLHQDTSASATAPVVRLIQPNAAQHEKWDPTLVPFFLERQLTFTSATSEAGKRPDLIVWPETAVPWTLDRAGPVIEQISKAAEGTPVVIGIQRNENFLIFNSLVLINATGNIGAIYDKHHLVPFGEYIPYGDFFARFGLHSFAAQGGNVFSAGPGPRLIELPRIGAALPLICYEAVFPQDVRAAPARPQLLLQITNDAWFGRFSGPQQHLSQARMRAIEQGLPLVRAANTGISAVIDAQGRVTASLALGEAGFVDARLPAPLPPTFYSHTGDWPVLALALLLMAASWQRSRTTRTRDPKSR